jgi:hypothetical protein
MTDTVLVPPDHKVPTAFTRAQLDWIPWLEPLAVDAMTARHLASLVDAARVKSPYFRLLARDPDALEARTRTDKDIFYNPDGGRLALAEGSGGRAADTRSARVTARPNSRSRPGASHPAVQPSGPIRDWNSLGGERTLPEAGTPLRSSS